MTKAFVAISTCTRPKGASYLKDTLRSIVSEGGICSLTAGGETPIIGWFIMHDGPLPAEIDDSSIRLTGEENSIEFPIIASNDRKRQGDLCNFWRVMEFALHFPDWNRLLFFEDDIRFLGKNSLLRMLTCPFLPDEGLIAFHDMKELRRDSPRGLHHLPVTGREGNGLWGLQAAAFPRVVIEYLATRSKETFAPKTSDLYRSDRQVEAFLLKSPWPFMSVHCPSLVRHVGDVSAAMPGETLKTRRSQREADRDFDAGLLVGKEEKRFNFR